MTQSLSWNLHGNDQLSGILEKLDRTVGRLDASMRGASTQAREYGRALGSAEAPATRFHGTIATTNSRLDGLSTKLLSVVSVMRTMAVTGAVALASAATAAGAFGIKMAAANEQAAISFELMLGSADKAQEFLGKLLKFAAATPFEMPQLRSAASRLLAVGTEADRIIPILTVLGDATAGMGTGAEGIERAVTALTQMRQKTKVTGEEMMQLTEAGIPAWETLASKLGVDVAEAMDMVTKREVDAGVIFDAVQERQGAGLARLTGMMTKQSTTLTGLWSTFKDNAGQALASFTEPAIPAIKKLLDFVSTAVPGVLTGIQTMSGQISKIFERSDVPEKLVNSLKDLAAKVLPALKDSWDEIVTTISDNREGLEKLGRFITDIVIPAIGVALPIAIDFVTTTIQTWIVALAHVVDAIRFMVAYWLAQIELILAGAEKAFGWVPGLGDKLRAAKAGFDEFAQGVMDKLNGLDGKKVDVYIQAHAYGAVGEHGGSGTGSGSTGILDASIGTFTRGFQEFAGGGMVDGPPGSPQWALVHGGERVLTPEQQRGMGRTQPDETVLAPLSINVEGYGVWQGMLAFKRRNGKVSLGLG